MCMEADNSPHTEQEIRAQIQHLLEVKHSLAFCVRSAECMLDFLLFNSALILRTQRPSIRASVGLVLVSSLSPFLSLLLSSNLCPSLCLPSFSLSIPRLNLDLSHFCSPCCLTESSKSHPRSQLQTSFCSPSEMRLQVLIRSMTWAHVCESECECVCIFVSAGTAHEWRSDSIGAQGSEQGIRTSLLPFAVQAFKEVRFNNAHTSSCTRMITRMIARMSRRTSSGSHAEEYSSSKAQRDEEAKV